MHPGAQDARSNEHDVLVPTLRDASLRDAPQGEVFTGMKDWSV